MWQAVILSEGEEDASKACKVESKQAVDQAASSTPVVSKVGPLPSVEAIDCSWSPWPGL